MAHKVITPVTVEPVSLAEANLHLKISTDLADVGPYPEDSMVEGLITAAREFAEHHTGRALAPQTLEMALDAFPIGGFDLDCPPVASISGIKFTDPRGVEQVLDPLAYRLSTYGDARRVEPAHNTYWPATLGAPESVRIQYVAGYGICPKAVKTAILIDIQLHHDALTPQEIAALESARDSLLDTKKIWGR